MKTKGYNITQGKRKALKCHSRRRFSGILHQQFNKNVSVGAMPSLAIRKQLREKKT